MSADGAVNSRIRVSGRVQGVAYRAFAQEQALLRGLVGGVRNLPDGRVEVEVEGDRRAIETLIEILKVGPPAARVRDLQVEWDSTTGRHQGFHIWY